MQAKQYLRQGLSQPEEKTWNKRLQKRVIVNDSAHICMVIINLNVPACCKCAQT